MRIPRVHLSACLALTLLILFSSGCKKNDGNPVDSSGGGKGTIATGAQVDAGSMPIGPGGGTFTISKPGTPVDGMRIDVPANAYPDARTFQVSYAPIQSHQLGQYFTPISPLITISNGGDYSDSVMRVTIPIKVAPEEVAMAFFYDPATGELEGLPMISRDSTLLTIATRHFASSALSNASGLKLADVGRTARIVVSKVLRSLLNTFARSGFVPHADDWQFKNLGSRITPEGNCGGQSATAIWYYLNKKSKGAPQLWGLLDNDGNAPPTPSIWQDDVLTYKVCSMVQDDNVWTNFSGFLAWIYQGAIPGDAATFELFTYALLITHKPAMVLLGGSGDVGHAVICYASGANILYIADPNLPGNMDKTIEFDGTYFKPYDSGPKADQMGVLYPTVRYGGNSALLNFSKIEERWQQMVDKTIGNEKFPAFTLSVTNDSNKIVPLKDGYIQHKQSISILINAPSFNPGYILFDELQNTLDPSTSRFSPGKHKIGVAVYDDNGDWVGFQWTNIVIGADSSILPLAVGNSWNYTETGYGSDGRVIATHTRETKVIGTTTVNGEIWYQVQESVDGGTPAVTLFANFSNGLWAVEPPANPFLVYEYPATAGDTYLMGTSASVRVDSVTATRVLAAGTFTNCVVYTIQYSPTLPFTVRTFAAGVGELETRDYERLQGGGSYLSDRIQLVSYVLK